MMLNELLQHGIHSLEEGRFARWLRYVLLAVTVLGVAVIYDLTSFRNFSAPGAMDAAQVGRNLADGRGFSTEYIRPFSVFLVKEHNLETEPMSLSLTNTPDYARVKGPHPDLAHAPVYPTLLAGFFKLTNPDWRASTTKAFWANGGYFLRYQPEFFIALLNQFFLLIVAGLTFAIARKLFDAPVAWLAALLTLATDALWRFSVSGLSTLLLLVIFLGLVLCLIHAEEAGRGEKPAVNRLFTLAIVAGLLVGLGMLTRYAFGWLIVPVILFFALFGGVRRPGLAVAAFLAFAAGVTPWIIRNLAVSGTLFGTAGYAIVESTSVFPGTRLMQSLHPEMNWIYWIRPCLHKLVTNFGEILQGDLLRVGGSWIAVLFFAGLLLGLRSAAARRMRYFTLMSLLVLAVAQALGETSLSTAAPEINSENLLVLLTPLVVIFGVVFFLTLLGQMKLPAPQLQIPALILMCVFVRLPLVAGFFPPYKSTLAYPPYYPPEIQKVAGWMQPGDLLMSDIPWAVAWYGNRPCALLTLDAKDHFFQFNDNVKHVDGLYLTLNTLNSQLYSECLKGGAASWGNFALRTIAGGQVPQEFTLRYQANDLSAGMFLTDRARWQTR